MSNKIRKWFSSGPALRAFSYSNEEVLRIKKETHLLYSVKPIDLNLEVIKRLNLNGSESILDIGCGLGDFLLYLRQKVEHRGFLYGLDICPNLFEKARQKVLKRRLNIKFIEGDAEKLPFKDQSFDVICAQHMLCHLSSTQRGIKEARRVLKGAGNYST